MDIHWYPGHMARTRRQIIEDLKLVDVVIEVLDARIPSSSRNPEFNKIAGQKPRLVVLNKSGLAESEKTRLWLEHFRASGFCAAAADALQGRGMREIPALVRELAAPIMAALAASGRRPRAPRCMVLGIPNVGKSLLINRLVGHSAARTGDKPGVTRGRQWIRVAGNIDLLDTPGILWPKLEDAEAAFRLAATGALKDEAYDFYAVAGKLVHWLAENHPDALKERYKLDQLPSGQEELLEAVGAARGYYLSGGVIDTIKSARILLKEFREGRLGRYTLDEPPYSGTASS
ncbi:MAG TPA: ribosome biogenesis GTPase YlqF [Bacillota bacterium]|nr:ribosome biogenesis GTPase YlqF [Peptococcaceae bacterium MAG4]HPZ44272.1 ribosome biogenesis GTPase YlqF [Bacillota bacterium]HUM59568.1 ribosome biogenesis GTPase YlqF [Bacillota bacterium]